MSPRRRPGRLGFAATGDEPMPTKRRVDKARRHRISAEAVAAYRAKDCNALHRALRLRPWEASPLCVDQGPRPAVPRHMPPAGRWRRSYSGSLRRRCVGRVVAVAITKFAATTRTRLPIFPAPLA